MNKIIDGKAIADTLLRKYVGRQISNISKYYNPGLAVVMVGDDPASLVYVRKKIEICEKYKINPLLFQLSSEATNEQVISKIEELNKEPSVFGILVQLPLPQHLDRSKILSSINTLKDVDCLHPQNLGYLSQGREFIKPCAVEAVMQILLFNHIDTKWKRVAIINRSPLIGKPLANILSQNCETGNATVTICHEFTPNLKELCKCSDIIITAVGKRNSFVIDNDFIKNGAVIIDVGFTKIGDKVFGDVDFSKTTSASLVAKVPNGVGPVTIACLLWNFVKVASYQIKKSRRKTNGLCRCGRLLDRHGSLCVECNLKYKESKNLKILAKTHLEDVNKWEELYYLLERQKHVCPYTGIKLALGENASLDRIMPKSKGGKNKIDNLQWVYKQVNFMKWDYLEQEFLETIRLIYEHKIARLNCAK